MTPNKKENGEKVRMKFKSFKFLLSDSTPYPSSPRPVPQLPRSFLSETLFSVSATRCQSKLSHCLFFSGAWTDFFRPFPSTSLPADGASLALPPRVPLLELPALHRPPLGLACSLGRSRLGSAEFPGERAHPPRFLRGDRTPGLTQGKTWRTCLPPGRGDSTGPAQHLRGALLDENGFPSRNLSSSTLSSEPSLGARNKFGSF